MVFYVDIFIIGHKNVKVGSGSGRIRIYLPSGYGSVDPEKIFKDPQHWEKGLEIYKILRYR